MSRHRSNLSLQCCLLCRLARRYGPHPATDLLEVDYRHVVPPDTEFPRIIPQADLFARFHTSGVGPTRIWVRVVRLDADGTDLERVNSYPFVVPFDPTASYREHVFRLKNIRLTGTGLYAVRVGRRLRSWSGPKWRQLGFDYFRVER